MKTRSREEIMTDYQEDFSTWWFLNEDKPYFALEQVLCGQAFYLGQLIESNSIHAKEAEYTEISKYIYRDRIDEAEALAKVLGFRS